MYCSRVVNLSLALTGLCALAAFAARPATAQTFIYTLSGVTFADGATATGSFDFDPTTQTFSNFDITTTDGLTDTLAGGSYLSGQASTYHQQTSAFSFIYNGGSASYHALTLVPVSSANVPGVYLLAPGTPTAGTNQFVGSGESLATADRLVVAGSLDVAAPVPEASTTVSFGLLLALGLGGAVIAAKKKKAAASA